MTSMTRWTARLGAQGARDRGSIAPIVPLFALVMLLLGGLVIDASRLLNARGRAVAYAEEAARAGASAVRPGLAVLDVDPALAEQRVETFCASLLADEQLRGGVQRCEFVDVERLDDGRRIVVRVAVQLQIAASLLGIVGVDVLTASGEARARPFEGVTPDDVDSGPPPVVVPDNPVEDPPPVEVPAPEVEEIIPGLPCILDVEGIPGLEQVPECDPDAPPIVPQDCDGDGLPDVPVVGACPQPSPQPSPEPSSSPEPSPEPSPAPAAGAVVLVLFTRTCLPLRRRLGVRCPRRRSLRGRARTVEEVRRA